ncbi:hypothetical protein J8L73_18745 [Pseudoalteromonas sp. MMG006]|uniref:hypothetical protein n=1 Tax=unclassified Pseudoalteromonas TaxID=194690 RepID=UPI001600E2C4|nr:MULTISPECIES: hypothetical protein [unclassified Pseudoalteromonas]MBB1468993.1 hypothetical protein [Pseudoalteromonas sp. SG41-5]MBQ4801132.1 hypothetical protein [Pseudoalteromonas sp. MMG006]
MAETKKNALDSVEQNLKSAKSILLAKYDVTWISDPSKINPKLVSSIDIKTMAKIDSALEMLEEYRIQ